MDAEKLLAATGKPLENMPPSGVYVDEEGDWYYQKERIIREDIVELFLANLSLVPDGPYFIDWRGQRCALEVADTPFIVTRVDRVRLDAGHREEIILRLKHLADTEVLDPSTLRVGKDNIPYCTVRKGLYRARFSRPAYYQLAAWIDFDPVTQRFFIELNGTRYPFGDVAPP